MRSTCSNQSWDGLVFLLKKKTETVYPWLRPVVRIDKHTFRHILEMFAVDDNVSDVSEVFKFTMFLRYKCSSRLF